MRRPLQFATAILTLSFAATMLSAQSQSKSAGGASTSQTSTASTAARTSNGTSPSFHAIVTAPHRAISTTPTPGKPDPFHRPVHLPGGGGCYNCGYGYGTYGGYVYGGYVGTYPTNPVGPTATDRILANGGTFNNINDTNDEQQPATQAAPIYIRPEYSTQYATDNSTVNTPIQNTVASASSDSPAILVFRDGTNLTIRNYAIYGAFIVVLTPERKKFPIAALDVPATEKANEAAGYELKIPAVFTSH